MGQFAKRVRRNKIPGPNQRGFCRSFWESQIDEATADNDDKRLLHAGLFFDKLLLHLRKEKKLSVIPLSPDSIIRFAIAIATSNLFYIHDQTRLMRSKGDTVPTIIMSQVMERKMEVHNRQQFSPDELITGAGDGLKHMLRELLIAKEKPGDLTEYQAESHSVDLVNFELNIAILYQCAVEYWNDCVGNGYGLVDHYQGIALVPFDEALEVARTVSTYRRQNIALQDMMFINEQWIHTWPRKLKEHLCEIPLVSRVSGHDRIEHIQLAKNSRTLSAASSAVAAKLWLQNSYYKFLLDDPLPKLSGFSLNQIILGWQLLQSLSEVILASLKPIDDGNVRHLLSFAPRISKHVLCATFAKALSLDRERTNQLVNVFVFDSSRSQEVWFQPLVSLQDDYCLVIPCIYSVQLIHIIEGWMRLGGLELDRRGPEFEKFCRNDLESSLQDSPIKDSVLLLDQPVCFTPPTGREEEIDIVVIVSNTILLIEAKCILWPDESLQFSNYRNTVEKAVVQVVRKRDAVRRNYNAFSERLKQLGCSIPPNCSVIACVLTNSAVYSGFPINGIPIADLSILGTFFKNEHVKIEARQAGRTVQRHSITFYTDAVDAGCILEDYLVNPPQLSDSRASVKRRELVFPIEISGSRKLIHELYSVEIDVHEIQRRYGVEMT